MADIEPPFEPTIFAAGDSLYFYKYLPDYLPTNGWSLEYILTDMGGHQLATIQAVADGDKFKISQQAFAAELNPGPYVFSGTLINAAQGYRHQIYYGNFKLTPDLTDGTASGSLQTEAQQMLCIIIPTLKSIYGDWIKESDVQRSRFLKHELDKIRAEYAYWKEKRFVELDEERARNGQPMRRISNPVFMIG